MNNSNRSPVHEVAFPFSRFRFKITRPVGIRAVHLRRTAMRSAIILVGGEARRANGQEKFFFLYQGKTFIERLVDSLRQVTDEIILVAKSSEQCRRFDRIQDVRCIADIRQGIGPIGGLHAGVLAANGDLLFVSACDMPCIETAVVSYLFETIGTPMQQSPAGTPICSSRSMRCTGRMSCSGTWKATNPIPSGP